MNIHPNRREVNIQINNEEDRNVVQRVQGEIKSEKKTMLEVEKKVRKVGLTKWKEKIENKPSLKLYTKKEMPRREEFYDGGWESKLLFKARSNSLEIGERKNRWTGEEEYCKGCLEYGDRITESIEHIIIECPRYFEEREKLIRNIEEEIGRSKWEEIKGEGKELEHLLGFAREGDGMTKLAKGYLGEIWRQRQMEERENPAERRNRIMEVGEEHNYT